MIVDKTNIVTKIVGVLCGAAAAVGLYYTLQGFILYRFIVAVVNLAIALVCFLGTGKDREILTGIFAFMIVFEIVRVFTEESLTLTNGLFLLLRVGGYVSLPAYFLYVVKNKWIPIIGGSVVSLFMIRNMYNLVLSYRNIEQMSASMGMQAQPFGVMLGKNMIGLATYVIPTLAIVILILSKAVKFPMYKND